MIVYKVFYKNYELKKAEPVGILIERRKDLRGMAQVESGMRWAKLNFGHVAKEGKAIFVIPYQLKLGVDTHWLMEKGVFTKEELIGMGKLIRV